MLYRRIENLESETYVPEERENSPLVPSNAPSTKEMIGPEPPKLNNLKRKRHLMDNELSLFRKVRIYTSRLITHRSIPLPKMNPRVQVGKLDKNGWLDLGTGFCSGFFRNMSRPSKGFADFFPNAPSVLRQKKSRAAQAWRKSRSPAYADRNSTRARQVIL